MIQKRIRLHFSKNGNLCFIGHRDLLRTMDRLLRRARLPLVMSQGFHPKPKVSYYSALSLGFSSQDEVMEMVLSEPLSDEEVLTRLNETTVPGLEFFSPQTVEDSAGKIRAVSYDYEVAVPEHLLPGLANRVSFVNAASCLPVVKSRGREIDLKKSLLALDLRGHLLSVRLAVADFGPEATMKEVLIALERETELFRTLFPVRVKTNLA